MTYQQVNLKKLLPLEQSSSSRGDGARKAAAATATAALSDITNARDDAAGRRSGGVGAASGASPPKLSKRLKPRSPPSSMKPRVSQRPSLPDLPVAPTSTRLKDSTEVAQSKEDTARHTESKRTKGRLASRDRSIRRVNFGQMRSALDYAHALVHGDKSIQTFAVGSLAQASDFELLRNWMLQPSTELASDAKQRLSRHMSLQSRITLVMACRQMNVSSPVSINEDEYLGVRQVPGKPYFEGSLCITVASSTAVDVAHIVGSDLPPGTSIMRSVEKPQVHFRVYRDSAKEAAIARERLIILLEKSSFLKHGATRRPARNPHLHATVDQIEIADGDCLERWGSWLIGLRSMRDIPRIEPKNMKLEPPPAKKTKRVQAWLYSLRTQPLGPIGPHDAYVSKSGMSVSRKNRDRWAIELQRRVCRNQKEVSVPLMRFRDNHKHMLASAHYICDVVSVICEEGLIFSLETYALRRGRAAIDDADPLRYFDETTETFVRRREMFVLGNDVRMASERLTRYANAWLHAVLTPPKGLHGHYTVEFIGSFAVPEASADTSGFGFDALMDSLVESTTLHT